MKKNTLLASILPFVLGATVAQATGLLTAEPDSVTAQPVNPLAPGPQHAPDSFSPKQSLAPLVSALQPAVVNIHVEQKVRNEMMPMMDDDMMPMMD